jgi:hypothetical protein
MCIFCEEMTYIAYSSILLIMYNTKNNIITEGANMDNPENLAT